MFEEYRARMFALGSYEGETRRRNSQKIMDTTWRRDASTKPVYVKWVDSGLPHVDDIDVPVYAKYNVKSYHNITGDEVAYLLQFRLSDIKENHDIKVGSYVYIPNELNEFEWWLIVHYDDRPQFRQFSILKCTWTYRWVSEVTGYRRIYECLGAPRKQNSYNSGVWLDYTTQTVENQDVFWVPTNSDTKTIVYDTKFLKSEKGRVPPLAYKVSKIEDTAIQGITKFTMTQEMFDPDKDNAELMIANYHNTKVTPIVPEIEIDKIPSVLTIAHSGAPTVKTGGGYKKLTLQHSVDGELKAVTGAVEWKTDREDKIELVRDGATCKVKVKGDFDPLIIGQKFTVTAVWENSSKTITMEVIGI